MNRACPNRNVQRDGEQKPPLARRNSGVYGPYQCPAHTSWFHSSQRGPKPTQPSHLLITLQNLLLHTLFLLFLHLFCTLPSLRGLPQALFLLPGQHMGKRGPLSSTCSQSAHSKWEARGKFVLTKERARGKRPNSLLHFCLTPSLLLLHFLLPLFLSLLLLPEVFQSLPLLLLKGEFRLYPVLGAVSPLRQTGICSHCWNHSPAHQDGE